MIMINPRRPVGGTNAGMAGKGEGNMRVITYTDTSGQGVSLTPRQVAICRARGVWPRNYRGEEYATVSHGAHQGAPSYATTEELLADCQ